MITALTKLTFLSVCSVLLTAGLVTPVLAIELYTTGLVGVDSNPHLLSDSYTLSPQEYIYADFKFSADRNEMFFIQANASKADYLDDDRADWYQANMALSFKSDFEIKKHQFNYQFSVDYWLNDETYVSPTTGLVASFAGASLADRFDSSITNINAALSYQTKQNAVFKISYQQQDKSYQQLNITALSNLDHQHSRLTLAIDYNVSDSGLFFIETYFTERDYSDRRAKDLEGIDIVDSNLIFSFMDIKMGYLYHPNKDILWQYTFNYTERKDNASDFWNSDSSYLSIYTEYNFSEYHLLSVRLNYSKYSYLNQIDSEILLLDEQNKERQGFTLSLDYQWILYSLLETQIGFYVSAEASVFESSNRIYEYQRNSLSAGIRWTL